MEHDELQDMVRAVRQFVRSEVVPEETTIDESDAITNRAENQGIGRAKPPKSLIMRVCRRS